MRRSRFSLVLIAILLTSVSAFGRDLLIAGIPEEPNRWVDGEGKLVGLDIDIVDAIMKRLQVNYRVILLNSSARLEAEFKKEIPEIDMVFTLSKTTEREAYLYYPRESHIAFTWNFFIRKADSGKIHFDRFEDLSGLRIGATKGFAYSSAFWKAAEDGILHLDEITQNDLQIRKLLAGRIDAVPLNAKATLYDSHKNGYRSQIEYLPKAIRAADYYNTFVRRSKYPGLDDLRKNYDDALAQMKTDGALKAILAKYGL